ncbi:cation transporter [Novymonas esmeraldas]|uniref:Cation transporter n=1 Tax=Novymonas esmeraldas TaxID=1808958 RepID=A0AAW0EPG1_9TRYP
MYLPSPLLSLTASACLVFAYHCARYSGSSVVWLSSFVAVLSFLTWLPHLVRPKVTTRDVAVGQSRLLSVGGCALLSLCATYALTTLGPVRCVLACACAAGAPHILRSKGSVQAARLCCTALASVLLAYVSDPAQDTSPSALFGSLGVASAVFAVRLSTTNAVKEADQVSFFLSAVVLGVAGFAATLVQRKAVLGNEMLLLLVFCVAVFVVCGCLSAGLALRGTGRNLAAVVAGALAASVVCGERVLPPLGGWECGALLASACLIFVSHLGVGFADPSAASLGGVTFNPAQMFKKTKQHREDGGILASLLSNSRERRLFVFLLLTFGIMCLEFIYGVAVNSLGLISDSFHMMLDGTSIAIGLYAAHAASWRPDEKTHPFGYARYEVFGGFVNGILLLFIALYVMVESIQRIFDPPEIEGPYLLLVSGIGLAVNIVGVVFFHDAHSHGHSHSHGQSCSGHVDHNMRGVYLHILADLLGSVSVILSSILIYSFGMWIADPICSAMSAVLILLSAFPLLEETGKVLLLSAPKHGENYADELREAVLATALLQDMESPKIWTHSTPPRELTVCTMAGKLRSNTDYTSARKRIIEMVTAHMLRHLGAHNVSVVLHLE